MRTPRKGDVYVLTRRISVTKKTGYAAGSTLTLLGQVNKKSISGAETAWRCVDQFGIGEWWEIEEFIKDGTLRLICSSP